MSILSFTLWVFWIVIGGCIVLQIVAKIADGINRARAAKEWERTRPEREAAEAAEAVARRRKRRQERYWRTGR